MKKVLEIVLVSVTIILSLLLTYYQVNKIEGVSKVYLTFYSSLVVLSSFYAVGIKNKIALAFHIVFTVGIAATIFFILHWPGGLLAVLLDIGMLGTSFLCVTSAEVFDSKKSQKLLVQLIGACIIISVLGDFTSIAIVQIISGYVCYAIVILLSVYFAKKDRIRYSFENSLKVLLVYFITLTILMLGYYVSNS
ncbi:MAG: hypothetical protein ACJAZ2_002023 [Glaciecola sp.]|jgi:hypothetical protein